VNPDWSKRIAQSIGAEVVELPGSHSPFYSRPQAVADVLLRIAERAGAPSRPEASLG